MADGSINLQSIQYRIWNPQEEDDPPQASEDSVATEGAINLQSIKYRIYVVDEDA